MMPSTPDDMGIEHTIFRRDPVDPSKGLFELPNSAGRDHPYLKQELLTKIFNNVTTRSNVFAVWCTVGYFEIRGTSSITGRPVLGREMQNVTPGDLRRKFFAVIDRTNLTLSSPHGPVAPSTFDPRRYQGPRPVFFTLDQEVNVTNLGQPITIRIPATSASFNQTTGVTTLSGTYNGHPWTISPQYTFNGSTFAGTQLFVGLGNLAGTQEEVTVTSCGWVPPTNGQLFGGYGQITITCNKPHRRGEPISTAVLGNPGPQDSFSIYSSPVVPYWTKIN
jgi:hypothetical protein